MTTLPQTPRRILVIGGGVIGTVYASWLQQAGHRVTILARGRRLVELRERGLIVEDAGTHQRLTAPVATVDHLDVDDPYDLLIVAVRLDQVAGLLPLLAATTAIPTVLFMVNNALGAEQFPAAIHHDRTVLGFPGIGGMRDGASITYYVLPQQHTTLGESSGRLTPRLSELAALIAGTGHRVALTTRMDAWLKTHAVFVSTLTAALDRCGGDSEHLAQDRKAVDTMVRAIRDGFRALRAVGVPTTPRNLAVLFNWMPTWFAVRYWQRALRGPLGTLAIAPHARAARSEMAALATQILALIQPTLPPSSVLRTLLAPLVAVAPAVQQTSPTPTEIT